MNKGTVIVLSAAQVKVNNDINALKLEVQPSAHDIIHVKQVEQQDGVAVEDTNKALVRQVVESCRPLLEADPADEQAVQRADRAREECRQIRLAVEKWHSNAKEEAKFIGKALDGYKNELVRDGVQIMEDALKAFMQQAANLKQAELAKENQRIDERYKQRYINLTERLGMSYNGIMHSFELGCTSVTQDIVRLSDDAALKKLLQDYVLPEYNRIKQERADEENRKKLADEVLARDKAAAEALAKQEQEQTVFDNKRKEEDSENTRVLRAAVLEGMGVRRNGLILHMGLLTIAYPVLSELTEEQFQRKVEEFKAEHLRLKSLVAGTTATTTSSLPETSMPLADYDKLVTRPQRDAKDREQMMSIAEDLQSAYNKMGEEHFTSEIAKHDMRNVRPRLEYVLNWIKAGLKDL